MSEMTDEVWKDIEGYEGLYAVSNMGRVKSIARDVECGPNGGKRVIKETIKHIGTYSGNNLGYKIVVLSKNGKPRMHYVHRLVAEAFVPHVEGCGVVNHLDCNKNNNRADNLEWTTYKKNSIHAKTNGLYVASNRRNMRKIVNIETGVCFESITSASKQYGVSCLSLLRALKNTRYTCCGYHWKYVEQKG